MKKSFLILAVAIIMLFGMASVSGAFYMNFEEGLGNDGGNIVGIPGVTFTNSADLPWVYADITTGNYNVTSVDTGATYGTARYNMYGDVAAWLGTSGSWGRIDFDDMNGTWFQTGVSTATDFWLEAYDASDNLLDTATTGPCTQWEGCTDMVWLRVDAPSGTNIAYVILHDTGNYWEVDEMTGDMAGGVPVPEPATLFLLGAGLLGIGAARKRIKG